MGLKRFSSGHASRKAARRKAKLLFWGLAALMMAGVIGLVAYFAIPSQEEPEAQAEVVELAQAANPIPQVSVKSKPAPRMEVASILFEPQRQVIGEWAGAIVLRDGNTIPFRIQGVDHTGFTAVAVRCRPGQECQIGVEVDQEVVSEDDIQGVVDELLAVARQITTGNRDRAA